MHKETLHPDNARFATEIRNKRNPEQVRSILYDTSNDENAVYFDGRELLIKEEYKEWAIESWKEDTPETIDFQLGYDAHRNTSFSPEVRAERHMRDFRNTLAEAKKEIAAVPNIGDNVEAEYLYFKSKAKTLFTNWLHAKGRCISSMITGGSNFPVRRAQKANNAEQSHGEKYFYYLNNYIKKLTKRYKPTVTIEGELEGNIKKLEALKKFHEMMKVANRILKSKKTGDVEKVDKLQEAGFKEDVAISLLEPIKWGNTKGFARFQLSNNLATIKNTEARIKVLQAKTEATDKVLEENDLFKCEVNAELDRIMFFFDGKPSYEIRVLLKGRAFRWSRKNGAWQRKTTSNAMYATRHLITNLKGL